jgi:hypothetical protein
MQCTLLYKWLDRLPSDFHIFKSFPRIQVQEYGPLDLVDGAEWLMAVQTICRLLLGLGLVARLGQEETEYEQRSTAAKIRAQMDRGS